MSFEPVAALLEERLGLSAEALGGPSGLAGRCAARAAALGLRPTDYVELVLRKPSEVDELVESVVVPETWFFRDGAPFKTVAERAAATVRARPKQLFRVLCVPCSTGEEAYTIVMALYDGGLGEGTFTVHARDVSRVALDRARAGRYGRWSFRSGAMRGREHWFTELPKGGEWEVVDALRRPIEWGQANIMDPTFLALAGAYDAVFCRNLLIYLTPAARAHVVDRLLLHLAEDGVIVAGHAENLSSVDARLGLVPGSAFVWQRAGRAGEKPRKQPVRRRAPVPAPRTPSLATPALPSPPPPPSQVPPAPSVPSVIERARRLADAGRLDDARALCAEHLAAHPADAEACFLSGMLSSAAGDAADAERWFVRAVYLAPRHYEALVQLASLCEQRGDDRAARNYRRRADAAVKKEGP